MTVAPSSRMGLFVQNDSSPKLTHGALFHDHGSPKLTHGAVAVVTARAHFDRRRIWEAIRRNTSGSSVGSLEKMNTPWGCDDSVAQVDTWLHAG
jgi:hypothetical protein